MESSRYTNSASYATINIGENMDNIKTYNVAECQAYCRQLPFFDQLTQDFDILSWDKIFNTNREKITPREFHGRRPMFPEKTMFSMVPFFYLKPLLEKNPKTIYDLGAGWNIFKKYIPNIVGVSPTCGVDHYSDINDFVDQDYIQNHQDYFESVFSINALHFHPLTELKVIIQGFASMVATGGRGFLALNLSRMLEKTERDILIDIFGIKIINDITKEQYEKYVLEVLADIGLNYLIVDVDVIDDPMDGNIRIVFEK